MPRMSWRPIWVPREWTALLAIRGWGKSDQEGERPSATTSRPISPKSEKRFGGGMNTYDPTGIRKLMLVPHPTSDFTRRGP